MPRYSRDKSDVVDTNYRPVKKDSMEGQMTFGYNMDMMNPEEETSREDIIYNADGTVYEETALSNLTASTINEMMIRDPEAALELLLEGQSNQLPAKRGGANIAFSVMP